MENDKMINVLCIGKYDGEGKFTKNQNLMICMLMSIN